MKHAQTIAMARGLLADGRTTDVMRMIEPLLAPAAGDGIPVPDDPGHITLHALMARMRLLRYGDARRAQTLLAAFEDGAAREALPPAVRAEVALWLGWVHAWPERTTFDETHALHLLAEAERFFRDTHNASGRCWTLLGRAQTYLSGDEHPLLCEATDAAATLQPLLHDALADLFLTTFRIAAACFQGHYAEALTQADRLIQLGRQYNDPMAQGRGFAYQALLGLTVGRSVDAVLDAASEAESLLTRSIVQPGPSLLHASEAQVRAMLRSSRWTEAERILDRAHDTLANVPTAPEHLEELRIALLLRRGLWNAAQARCQALLQQVHRPQARRQEARVLLLHARSRPHEADQADRLAAKALHLAQACGDEQVQLSALLTRAQIWTDAAHPERARQCLQQAEPLADYYSLLPFAARRFQILGRLAHLGGRPGEAGTYLHLALHAYARLGDEPAHTHVNALLQSIPAPPEDEPSHLASTLAHAAISVPLVADTWLDAMATALPARWLGMYQRTEAGTWQPVSQHGTPPDLTGSWGETPCTDAAGLHWICLHTHLDAAFYLGVWLKDGTTWTADTLPNHVAPWLPVLRLALDHALLRARRLDIAFPHLPLGDEPSTLPIGDFVYAGAAMQTIARTLIQARNSLAPVLITGERGTGKAHVARMLHRLSERHAAPFVVFEGATMTPEVVEQTLFGAAGTNGHLPQSLLVQADGGTLFLDEVADLPREVQARLLQFLETGEVHLAGHHGPQTLDVRLIAASSHDLPALVRTSRFSEALYVRLGVLHLSLPPLRDRREDIPLLARYFLHRLQPPGTPRATITGRALEALIQYEWPGNLRQLRNELERALTAVRSEPAPMIDLATLSPVLQHDAPPAGTPDPADADWADLVLAPGQSLDDVLAHAEKTIIERVLAEHDGQVSASAQALGLTRQGLYKKMKRLTIDASAFQTTAEPDALAAASPS